MQNNILDHDDMMRDLSTPETTTQSGSEDLERGVFSLDVEEQFMGTPPSVVETTVPPTTRDLLLSGDHPQNTSGRRVSKDDDEDEKATAKARIVQKIAHQKLYGCDVSTTAESVASTHRSRKHTSNGGGRTSTSASLSASYKNKHHQAVVTPMGTVPHLAVVTEPSKIPRSLQVLVLVALLFGFTGTLFGVIAVAQNLDESSTNANLQGSKNGRPMEPCPEGQEDDCKNENGSEKETSLLDEIYHRGYVQCGFWDLQPGFLTAVEAADNGDAASATTTASVATTRDGRTTEQDQVVDMATSTSYVGLDMDLCRIVSAAIFGNSEAYRTTMLGNSRDGDGVDRWTQLQAGDNVDLLFRATHTMERDVHEPTAGVGFQFTKPYFYDTTVFGGLEDFVNCAELGITNSTCADLRVGVFDGTTALRAVRELLPEENLVVLEPGTNPLSVFPHQVNVLANSKSSSTEPAMREIGYDGPYYCGTTALSREPVSVVSREGDTRWSDFLEVIVHALIFAEEEGITKVTAATMPTTDLFGPQFESMLQNVVGVRGNYGELYVHNLEAFLSRGGLNLLNTGAEPRMLSLPFGQLDVVGPSLERVSPTVNAIKKRGVLRCGHNILRGTSNYEPDDHRYTGLASDLCRAISAALFDGQDRTLFVTTTFGGRYNDLQDDLADLLTTVARTLPRDVKNPSTGEGLTCSSVYSFAGSAFGGTAPFVDCAERLDIISPECQSLRICTFAGSATFTRFSEVLTDHFLVPMSSYEEIIAGLRDGVCNTLLTPTAQAQEAIVRASGYGEDLPFESGTRQFHLNHVTLATSEHDPAWSDFVNWVLESLVFAEEHGITSSNADQMPRTNLFGSLRTDAFYHAVGMVGNYGDIYERNMEHIIPRSGVHLLNDNTQPAMYSAPGIA